LVEGSFHPWRQEGNVTSGPRYRRPRVGLSMLHKVHKKRGRGFLRQKRDDDPNHQKISEYNELGVSSAQRVRPSRISHKTRGVGEE
jgi:hypothetical protein